jgi:metallo-beta-lactamase class B
MAKHEILVPAAICCLVSVWVGASDGVTPAATPLPQSPTAETPAAPEGDDPKDERLTINDELFAREVAKDTLVITHTRPYPANSLVVVAESGDILLVDTPWTPEATTALLRWLTDRYGPRRRQAVNTHFHLDSLGGNPALRDAGVPARGLVLTASLLRSRGRTARRALLGSLTGRPEERARFVGAELLPPSSLFMARSFSLPLGREEQYVMIHPGPSHSPDSLAVWLPRRKVLFAGDIVRDGDGLGYVEDADLEHWPEAVEELAALGPEIVVPGHGSRLDPGLLRHTLDLLAKAAPRSGPETPTLATTDTAIGSVSPEGPGTARGAAAAARIGSVSAEAPLLTSDQPSREGEAE